jgi:hypothetical protein
MTESLSIAVVDIGKLSNLGWAIEGPTIAESGTDVDSCVDALGKAMTMGPLALGLEAPMFVPYWRSNSFLKDGNRGLPSRVPSQIGAL